MHPNPAFRKADAPKNLAFALARGFGTLTVMPPGAPYPLVSHVPFVADGEGVIALHVPRSNAIGRALGKAEGGALPAVMAVVGPDGYVSPDWYGDPQQVPTWNYVAVHLRGTLSLAPPESLRTHLVALSARFEEALPKKPWTLDKMEDEPLARLERQLIPLKMEIAEIDGTWKLNQNKPEAARLGAAEAMPGSVGQELDALAAMMREPPA